MRHKKVKIISFDVITSRPARAERASQCGALAIERHDWPMRLHQCSYMTLSHKIVVRRPTLILTTNIYYLFNKKLNRWQSET